MLNREKVHKDAICHICKKKKYCLEDFYYTEKDGWNKVCYLFEVL